MTTESRHVVVILGGAVAGSEAAAACAERGALAVVLERNSRPYGKIEDGLPRWHVKLREKEYKQIDENLGKPGVTFLPGVALGRDVTLDTLVKEWGVSAVLLANGAWRDRPLGLPGADAYVDRGLVYQNPLVYWFNHYDDPGYAGPRYEVPDGAICIGGGLASIDVVKILSIEIFGRALRARGIETTPLDFEGKGARGILEAHKLTPEDLGVRGATLFYRRAKADMPLASPPDNATPAQIEKTRAAREKIMDLVIEKFFVKLEEHHSPVAPIVEDGRMVGVTFRRADGSEHAVRAPLTVSSIGSIPEKLDGIPMKGELYDWASWETGQLNGYDNVYGLGNVLTGKGNIKESRKNSRAVSAAVLDAIMARPPVPADRVASILDRARSFARG